MSKLRKELEEHFDHVRPIEDDNSYLIYISRGVSVSFHTDKFPELLDEFLNTRSLLKGVKTVDDLVAFAKMITG